jgi:hypothetical protein
MIRSIVVFPALAIGVSLSACSELPTPPAPSARSVQPLFQQSVHEGDFHCGAPPGPGPATIVPPVVKGNVIVHGGAFCIAFGSQIFGNVFLEPNASGYHQHGGRIEGSVFSDMPLIDVRILHLEWVGGDIQISRTRPGTGGGICGSTINGSVQLKQNAGGIDVGVGWPFDVCTVGNTINGNVQIEESGATAGHGIRQNRVNGNVQFFKNNSGAEISGNVIKGNLQCKENVPPPVQSGNTAQSIQCPSL